MSRPSLLALCLLAAAPSFAQRAARAAADSPGPAAAGCPTPDAEYDWGHDCHKEFFAYQGYLARLGLEAQTKETWAPLDRRDRVRRVEEGESFLKKRFAELSEKDWLSPDDEALLKAVWGEQAADRMDKVAKARALGDPAQLRQAMAGLDRAKGAFSAGMKTDLGRVFDGAAARAPVVSPLPPPPSAVVDGPPRRDYLRPGPSGSFLDRLAAPENKEPLKSREAFSEFLMMNEVHRDALPAFEAMYDVLTKAPPKERAEMEHILPTVVQFLRDGKRVSLEDIDNLGEAWPGDYDRPQAVKLSRAFKRTDPLIAAKTLSHEFQHIYDMYVGRYYTLDTELRGFKTAALFFRSIEKVAPDKYRELLNANDETTRAIVRDAARYGAALDRDPAAFADEVAFGHGYNRWHEGVFQGRVPLRDALDPHHGAPRELAARRALREESLKDVERLERAQADARRRMDATKSPGRALEHELERVTRDLAGARQRLAADDARLTLMQLRVNRMQSELRWLEARAKGQPAPYDLHLGVDKDYEGR